MAEPHRGEDDDLEGGERDSSQPDRRMSQCKARECRDCEGRETLITKLNSVDWTADELHLNGGRRLVCYVSRAATAYCFRCRH